MAAFFRGFLLFFFGVVLGAAGVLLFAPSFNVVVSRGAGDQPPLEFVAPPAPPPQVAKTPAAPVPAAPAVAVEPAAPAVAAAKPAPGITPAPEVASADLAIDFKAIAQHLILWPTAVTVKTATTVPVLADGKKVQDLALEAGTVLQVSKVLADGSLEARAKGAKFEIPSASTDFSVELGKRVADLVAKGTKFDSPFAAASPPTSTPAAPAALPAPVAVAPAAVAAVAKPLTLAQRVELLYGNKPESETPVNPGAPAAPAPVAPVPTPPPVAPTVPPAAPTPAAAPMPVVPAAPAPAADPKADEKGKDLDRKINQLFK